MKRKVTAVILLLVFSVGCSTTWLSTFDSYLAIAGPVLIQVLDIVSLAKGVPVNPALEAKINADSAALKTLAASVTTATGTSVPTTCAAFNLAVQTFADDLGQIEQLGNIGPNTSGEIGAAVGIVQAAIQEIEVPITACAAAPNSARAEVVLKAGALKVTSANEVLRRFNAVVDKKHRVHYHSFLVRTVSFGRLQ